MSRPQVTVVGGGMITNDQLLPSLYHLQRTGVIGEINICALNARPLKDLADSEFFARAFPGQSFKAYPEITGDLEKPHSNLFREVIQRMPKRNIVMVAVPDQLHYGVIMEALNADQHICTVKPLVLKTAQAMEIEQEAARRGLLVGIEYHKRFDDRSFMARVRYRDGMFGEFKLGTANLFEKWYYRYSNFQNWCTTENSDAFAYIGCHYVDLVHFITGLLPVSVSVYGLKDHYPNGNEGLLWTDARVVWNNGAALNVQNGLGFPDAGPGSNTQGITLYCSDGNVGALLSHDDQYKGIRYAYTRQPDSPGATQYHEPSPDYMQYVDLGGPGLKPVGYGYRSVEFIVSTAARIEQETQGLPESEALSKRQRMLTQIDQAGVMATPANSRYNELVMEAGRLSILNGGREVLINYDTHSVAFRQYD
ncbi:MAG TPA: Gfo/Idh/MocA family oxidoreductase [Bryobacteraceae bacterium]|nr:Gfo/Idh/MocA family oxidoreductase [Bryobacteraceae bacterium]